MILNINSLVLFHVLVVLSANTFSAESTCYGTTSNGALKGGVKLPQSGSNFIGYSYLASMAGRTYVHAKVNDIILNAYMRLEKEQPNKVYKYAETGFKDGGAFKPHKTHQNGLSVDFMTPVINEEKQSKHLPTNLLNKFGYDIEFDQKGKYKNYTIDYTAMAAHIVALHKESQKQGYDIWRVIFDPQLQPELFKTKYSKYLKENISFSRKKSWVRHDEHYHVDFSIPCEKL